MARFTALLVLRALMANAAFATVALSSLKGDFITISGETSKSISTRPAIARTQSFVTSEKTICFNRLYSSATSALLKKSPKSAIE